jgi:SAM-dependent methyltransferase
MSGNVFGEMGNYWAEIAEKHYTEKQVQFLQKTLKKTSLTLDLACGTARHLTPLNQNGFDVIGLDISPVLLKIAKKQNPNAQLVRGDKRSLPFKTGCFGAVISMDTSLGYLSSAQDDMQVLGEIRRTLTEEGLFVVDVFNKDQILSKHHETPIKEEWLEYPSFLLLQKRTVSKDGVRLKDFWVTKNYVDGKTRSFVHTVRLYDCETLEGLLISAGFVVEKIFGDYDLAAFSAKSKRLILTAKRGGTDLFVKYGKEAGFYVKPISVRSETV